MFDVDVQKDLKGFINGQIKKLYEEFKTKVQINKELCSLIRLDYQDDSMPNYKDSLVAHYYLLRYLPAYISEYYWIYNILLKKHNVPVNFSVLSLGSGNGLDYIALEFALQDKYKKNSRKNIKQKIFHQGVDILTWPINYSHNSVFEKKNDAIVKPCFQEMDFATFKINELQPDIIIFPKSFWEIYSNCTHNSLKIFFENWNTKKKIFWIIVAYKDSIAGDEKYKIKEIIKNTWMEKFYSWDSCKSEKSELPDGEGRWEDGLQRILGDWNYSQEIIKYLREVFQGCSKKNQNNCCDTKKCPHEGKDPILSINYMNWEIFTFTRKS